MKALFICDNKEDWGLLSNLFKAHFTKVDLVCALGGGSAMEYLSYEGPFGIILMDVSLRSDSPTELAQKILDFSGERPIIFLGDKMMINDRVKSSLLENEINDFIIKPYDVESFKQVVKSGLEWAEAEEFEQSVEEFESTELLPMKLRNFYLFNKLPYDVYLELTQTKFIRVISAGKPYTQSTLQYYSKRNIRYLYLKKNEYLSFLEDSIELLKLEFSKSGRPLGQVLRTQIKAALIIHQYLRTVGVSDSVVELVHAVIEKTEEAFVYAGGIKTVLSSFPRLKQDFAEHSILTMYFCETICEGLGWGSGITRKKLGLASLLQDFALSNEELLKIHNLTDPQLEVFNENDKEEFENHPKKAAEMANYFSRFPDTDFIILQHHELPNGEGFPHRLNANKLTVLSCVFALSSQFVARLVSNQKKDGNALAEIYYQFKATHSTGNFKGPLVTLEKMLKRDE